MSSTISIRIPVSQLGIINRAAKVCGKSRSSFMIEASCTNAINILLDRRIFHFEDVAFRDIQNHLDEPVKDNTALMRVLSIEAPWE